MLRIDLFTSPECPSCPRAKEVVAAFATEHPEVELREWDLATNPGPAVGRGIFATPSLLVNGTDVLFGVPTETELLKLLRPAATKTEVTDRRQDLDSRRRRPRDHPRPAPQG